MQIREEYAKLQRENNELKLALEKYKKYIEQIQPRTSPNLYEKPLRKRKFFKRNYERRFGEEQDDSDVSDEYITDVRKRRKKTRKRLIYDDEIDGDEQSEPEIELDDPEEKEKIINVIKKNKKRIKKKKEMHYEINKNVNFLFCLIFVSNLVNIRCKNLYLIKFK